MTKRHDISARLVAAWVLTAGWSVCAAAQPAARAGPADDPLDALIRLAAQVEREKQAAAARPIAEAAVCCGPWHVIGPFKDAEYGLFSREYDTAFDVEKDLVARAGAPADLAKEYRSVPVVGQAAPSRRWQAQPSWTDGYFHQLPVGPPPSRNEVVYLYRTINAARRIALPAHLLCTDAAKAWLNGKQVLDGPIRTGAGQRFLHGRFTLDLQPGENRLLVKIVSCFQRHGFSFAIQGLHPIHPNLLGAPAANEKRVFSPVNPPYGSAMWQTPSLAEAATPDGYVRKATWQETLLAWRERQRKAVGQAQSRPAHDLPFTTRVLSQKDGPQGVRLHVAGLQRLVLVCTIGGDDYGYDDTIWADPRLIDKDGRSVWLTDLKPARAEVGFAQLFVNRNLTGKKLKIGQREFDRGFWAHAPSLLVFELGGRYEWFECTIGLDALAVKPGSSEFKVLAEVPAEGEDGPETSVQRLLAADFPHPACRKEMPREQADGIWANLGPGDLARTVAERYAEATLRCLGLPPQRRDLLPATRPEDIQSSARLYHRARQTQESLDALRSYRFDVEPMPSYDPPELAMEKARAALAPTPGGAEFDRALAPVRAAAKEALEAWSAGQARSADKVVAAAEALDRFRCERIRVAGPVVYLAHPSFGRINAVNPYETPGRGPAQIRLFDPSRPDEPPRTIYDDPHGSVFDASLSYDARTLLFSARRRGVEGGWHIYEIGIDGSNLRQITSGPCDDISPAELPSGEIVFVSDRAGNYNVCQANRAGVLYAASRDGRKVRRISGHTLSDHSPAVMDDGRILFTRWDYGVDKGVFQRHGLWTVRPDGTALQLFFGNTVLDPNAFWQGRPVPGRPEVAAIFGGHHAGPYGSVGLITDLLGEEAGRGSGFRFLSPDLPTYWDGDLQNGYINPCPLNEREMLISYGGDGSRTNRLYLVDDRGNRCCIWEEAGPLGCYNPLPLRYRPRPPVLSAEAQPVEFQPVDPVMAAIRPDDSRCGTVLLTDVYRGLEGQVRRGEIKAIQILEQVPKCRPHTGGYAWNVSPTIGRGTFYVRRLIGTVDVQADGSACFTVPALRDVSFNALDAEGRVIQKMGSTTQVLPGETCSCGGCHESRRQASTPQGRYPLAAGRPPSQPRRPEWGTGGIIDYVQVVQPVWDRHCVKCHSGPRPKGGIDLSGDKTRYFNMSYNMLIDRGLVHHVPMNGADHDLTTPRANGSLASRIRPRIESDHSGRAVPLEDRQRVYTWIDANVPYYHTYLYTDGTVNGARDRWYARPQWASNDQLKDAWFQKDFAPVFMRRCFDCHKRTVDISDAWLGRCQVTVTSKVWTDLTLMDQGLQIEQAIATFGPAHRINLTHPDWSQMLTAPLAAASGGLGLCRDASGRPVFADTSDGDYQAMRRALRLGSAMLELNPRVDMLPRPTPESAETYAESLRQPRRLPPPGQAGPDR